MGTEKENIHLFNESGFSVPLDHDKVLAVSSLIEEYEQCSFSLLEVVYVDEDEIVRINTEHLGRDYVTDIITFRYDESFDNSEIEGTLFCCAPRIKEQAGELDEELITEFSRILVHGLLHLTGYEDQSDADKQKMTDRENFYLRLMFGS